MAGTTQEGTGKHPHKSAAEPEPHHEAPTPKGKEHESKGKEHETSHASSSHSSASKSHSDEQGTGKHPHKSAAEPEPHHEAPTTKGAKASSGSHSTGSTSSSSKESSPSTGESGGDLESRAYTGPDGKEHHHTKAYMEQHKGDK